MAELVGSSGTGSRKQAERKAAPALGTRGPYRPPQTRTPMQALLEEGQRTNTLNEDGVVTAMLAGRLRLVRAPATGRRRSERRRRLGQARCRCGPSSSQYLPPPMYL